VISEAHLLSTWRARPRGFVALMSLYESNYVRLAQLAGNLLDLKGTRVSHVAGECDLVLTLIERAPYTDELDLTYLVPAVGATSADSGPLERIPDLRLRVYHDARLLEARLRQSGPGLERELHQCWARNMMLNKWLEYCAEQGHCFVIR
jgi:uncharacterized protein YqiB (DUF1249 family)